MGRKNLWMVRKLHVFIREHREARNWSQTELGERAGVVTSTISRWERSAAPDAINVSVGSLNRAAAALGLEDAMDLFFPPVDHATAAAEDLVLKMDPAKLRRLMRRIEGKADQKTPEPKPARPRRP